MLTKSSSRRNFFKGLLASGTSFCFLGCPNPITAQTNEQHKFDNDSKKSFKEVFEFAYQQRFIPLMKIMGQEIGREKFISLLQEASSKVRYESSKKQVSNLEKNDFATYKGTWTTKDHFWDNVLSLDIIENTDSVFEVKVNECLWAKTFKNSDASDIGFACHCHTDFAEVKAFNPKLKLVRTKTLMQGHDCCNFRYTMET